MRTLLITLLLTTSTAAYSACTIKTQVKKANAKTVYVNGVSISQKIRKALATQCKIVITTMTKKDLIAMERASFQRKLDRITGAKSSNGIK